MIDISKFRTDPNLESEGVWVPIGEGARIKIARSGNAKGAELFERLTDPPDIKLAIRAGTLSVEKLNEIMTEVLSQAVLLDWEGITENGKLLPYTKENAKRILAIKDFRKLVLDLSQEQELFV